MNDFIFTQKDVLPLWLCLSQCPQDMLQRQGLKTLPLLCSKMFCFRGSTGVRETSPSVFVPGLALDSGVRVPTYIRWHGQQLYQIGYVGNPSSRGKVYLETGGSRACGHPRYSLQRATD